MKLQQLPSNIYTERGVKIENFENPIIYLHCPLQCICECFTDILTLPACELVRRQRLECLSLSGRERREIWRLTQAESAQLLRTLAEVKRKLRTSGLNLFGALCKNSQPGGGNNGDCVGEALEIPLYPLPTISTLLCFRVRGGGSGSCNPGKPLFVRYTPITHQY